MNKVEKALRNLLEKIETDQPVQQQVDEALQVILKLDKDRATTKKDPDGLSAEARAIIVAKDAVEAHSETHRCGACFANALALFRALDYWIMYGEDDGGKHSNRARLEEVFGEKKQTSEEGKGKAEGTKDQGKSQDHAKEGGESWEDDWK